MIDNANLGSDEEVDIYEPGTSGELLSFLKRNFNSLNESNLVVRKKAMLSIQEKLTESKYQLSGMISQQIVVKFQKQLLACFSDKSEKIREHSLKILTELLSKCDDMLPFLPYVFSILCERVNCADLEGILNIPEVMRPPPGQKPKMLIKLVEDSEELRQEICKLMEVIVTCSTPNMLYNHVDDICNILRALTMDPCGDVQRLACKCVSEFCNNNKELLLHFTEILARGLLLPLISKKSKVRIAALEALGSVLQCGVWKYNANVFEILVGFRDPNSVAIKDFYEPSHNINYLATFITDPKVQVRDMFLRCVGDWVSRLADRYDHLPRLIPYLVSGLFDEFEEIRETCFEVLEEVGQEEEKEKEKELRDSKQHGMDAAWSYGGKLRNLPLPAPLKNRPCLGARMLVRSQYRKFQKALFAELKDSNLSSRIRAANLLRISIIYCEDHITQHLDDAIRSLLWSVVSDKPEDCQVQTKIQESFFYIGRYCDYPSYLPIIISGLKGEFYQNQDYIRCSFESLAHLVAGCLEAIPEGYGLGKKKALIEDIIDTLSDPDILNSISNYNFANASNLITQLLKGLFKQGKKEEIEEILNKRGQQIIGVIGVISYIQLVDKAFLASTPLNESLLDLTLQAIQKNELFRLQSDLVDYAENKQKLFEDMISQYENEQEKIHFGDAQWRALVSNMLYQVLYQTNFSTLNPTFNVINSMVRDSKIPDQCDFIGKLNALLVSKILFELKKEEDQIQDIKLLTNFYGGLIETISALLSWIQGGYGVLKLTAGFITNFLLLIKFNIEGLLKPELEQLLILHLEKSDLSFLSEFLIAIPSIFKQYYKKQDIEFSKLVNFIIKRMKKMIEPHLTKLFVIREGKSVYAIPTLISFTLERIERLGETPDMKIAAINFESLDCFLDYIPIIKDSIYKGDKHIIGDYLALVQKLLKYALDEKDIDLKPYFYATLKKLVDRTTFNFRMEYESATSNKQFARIDLLRAIQPQ